MNKISITVEGLRGVPGTGVQTNPGLPRKNGANFRLLRNVFESFSSSSSLCYFPANISKPFLLLIAVFWIGFPAPCGDTLGVNVKINKQKRFRIPLSTFRNKKTGLVLSYIRFHLPILRHSGRGGRTLIVYI